MLFSTNGIIFPESWEVAAVFDAMAAPSGTNMDTQETQQVEVWWIMDLEVHVFTHIYIR